jgi:hypothetical protein
MTSIQFAQRALRILTARDLASLPMTEAAHVVDAMNEAMAAYTALLPAERRISTDSRSVRSPIEQPVSLTTGAKSFTYDAGSAAYPAGGYGMEAETIGCSCLVSGDAALNRVQGSGELLYPYLGSAASATLTLYNDAHGFNTASTAIHGPVQWLGDTHSRTLAPIPFNVPPLHRLQTGEPLYYSVENHLGSEVAAEPSFLLRLWPIPIIAGVIRFNAERRFPILKLADLQQPKPLAIPEGDVPHLTALLHEALLLSPLLRSEPGLASTISAKAASARDALTAAALPRHASAPNQVLTAPGY